MAGTASQPITLAERRARALQQEFGPVSTLTLAERLGIPIKFDRWEVAHGRLLYFAECTRTPRQIVVNQAALDCVAVDDASRAGLLELIVAHELGHLLLPRPSVWASAKATEAAAHAFAQVLTGSATPPEEFAAALLQRPRPLSSLRPASQSY